jgi:hypothetical protein
MAFQPAMAECQTRQDNMRQHITTQKQDKTRKEKTRQDKTHYDKTQDKDLANQQERAATACRWSMVCLFGFGRNLNFFVSFFFFDSHMHNLFDLCV